MYCRPSGSCKDYLVLEIQGQFSVISFLFVAVVYAREIVSARPKHRFGFAMLLRELFERNLTFCVV